MKSKGFPIDKFKKRVADKNTKNKLSASLPDWVDIKTNQNIVNIMDEVIKEYTRISVLIIEKANALSLRERKIGIGAVQKTVGLNKGFLKRDRELHKRVIDFINSLNKELANLWDKKASNKPIRKQTKKELEVKIKNLKKDIKKLQNEHSTDYFKEFVNSDAEHDRKRLSAKIVDLNSEIQSLTEERNDYEIESKKWKRKYFSLQKIDKDTGEIHI